MDITKVWCDAIDQQAWATANPDLPAGVLEPQDTDSLWWRQPVTELEE